jgi:glycosyltransferase involved in cell wall biosynthesis
VNTGIRILFCCAFSDKKKNGVQRYSQEMMKCISSIQPCTHAIYWNKENGYVKSFIRFFAEYLRFINQIRIVHFVVLTPVNIPFLLIAKILKKKIITSYHGNHIAESPITKRPHMLVIFLITDGITRFLSDTIVSATHYLAKKLRLGKKTRFIVYPFDTEKLVDSSKGDKKHSDEIVFATASNFNIKEKVEGLNFLLEAMSKIEKERGSRLLVFGYGRYLEEFKEKYQNHKNIVFMGFRSDFDKFLRDSDVYIHISGLDNQPYAIIEALMQGKVIICNDLGGMVESIDVSNNYVVQLNSKSIHEALTKVIFEMENNLGLFKEKGEKNKVFAINKYSSKIISKKYLELYRDTLKNK